MGIWWCSLWPTLGLFAALRHRLQKGRDPVPDCLPQCRPPSHRISLKRSYGLVSFAHFTPFSWIFFLDSLKVPLLRSPPFPGKWKRGFNLKAPFAKRQAQRLLFIPYRHTKPFGPCMIGDSIVYFSKKFDVFFYIMTCIFYPFLLYITKENFHLSSEKLKYLQFRHYITYRHSGTMFGVTRPSAIEPWHIQISARNAGKKIMSLKNSSKCG